MRTTFFVIGKWVAAFPQAFDRIVRAGHVIGNHSYEHHYHVSDYDRALVPPSRSRRPTLAVPDKVVQQIRRIVEERFPDLLWHG